MMRVGTLLGPGGLVAVIAATSLLVTGCNDDAGTAGMSRPKPTPEESFALIMQTFNHRMKDVQGFVSPKTGGHSRMITSSQVSSELITPNAEGQPYRAKVTVVREILYSIQRSEDADAESEEQEKNRKTETAPIGANGVEVLDPELVSSPSAATRILPEIGSAAVTRREVEDERIFDLEYRNGRWTLLTKTDPNTERSIQNAFDQALATQL